MTRRFRLTRLYDDSWKRFNKNRLELSKIQKRSISFPEYFRRISNVDTLKELLKLDAKEKRRLGL